MKCLYPQTKTKTFKGTTTEYTHACGQCLPCRVTKSEKWVLRMLLEFAANLVGATFITLGYSPQNLPLSPSGVSTLEADAMTKFIKRLRKNTGLSKLRYFNTAEYGEKFGRPHYHIILFGLDVLDYRPEKPIKFTPAQIEILKFQGSDPQLLTEIEKQIIKAWQFKGHIKADAFNANRAAYVMKYVQKNSINDTFHNSDRLPEYHSMSRMPGLGIPGVKLLAGQLIKIKVYPEDCPHLGVTPEWKPIPFITMQQQTSAKHSENYSVVGGRQKGTRGLHHYPIDSLLRDHIIKSMEQQLQVSSAQSEKTTDILNDMQSRSELVLRRTGNVIALEVLRLETEERTTKIRKLKQRWNTSVNKGEF